MSNQLGTGLLFWKVVLCQELLEILPGSKYKYKHKYKYNYKYKYKYNKDMLKGGIEQSVWKLERSKLQFSSL